MSHTQHSVGGSVQSRCTKCRIVSRHIIVSLVGGDPARVQCTICDGFHNYRPPASAGRAGARAGEARSSRAKAPAERAPRRSRAASAVAEEWQSLVGEAGGAGAVPYDMERGYEAGGRIDHPAFGVGLVRKVIPPDKVEVLFREGIKRLRCRC